MWPWAHCKPGYAGASCPLDEDGSSDFLWCWQAVCVTSRRHSALCLLHDEHSVRRYLRLPSASYHSQNKPAQPLLLLFCGLTNPLVSTDSIRLHFTPCTSVTCHVSRPVLSGLFYWCGISQMIFLFCPNSAMVNKGWNLGCGPWVHMVWPLVTLVLFSHWPSTSVGPATDGASWCSCLRH